ncbi:hypothetical protein fugu_007224 [Takifugu bimaculatus]|uniref:DNA topoisomerase I n=1 Tax=Takifugu bimaculatus TaxID=433685 RepID=A0A4Z2B3P8_9TELE|nr:hypothetical protein fugu_007224 [Takifugu bimaculatus]
MATAEQRQVPQSVSQPLRDLSAPRMASPRFPAPQQGKPDLENQTGTSDRQQVHTAPGQDSGISPTQRSAPTSLNQLLDNAAMQNVPLRPVQSSTGRDGLGKDSPKSVLDTERQVIGNSKNTDMPTSVSTTITTNELEAKAKPVFPVSTSSSNLQPPSVLTSHLSTNVNSNNSACLNQPPVSSHSNNPSPIATAASINCPTPSTNTNVSTVPNPVTSGQIIPALTLSNSSSTQNQPSSAPKQSPSPKPITSAQHPHQWSPTMVAVPNKNIRPQDIRQQTPVARTPQFITTTPVFINPIFQVPGGSVAPNTTVVPHSVTMMGPIQVSTTNIQLSAASSSTQLSVANMTSAQSTRNTVGQVQITSMTSTAPVGTQQPAQQIVPGALKMDNQGEVGSGQKTVPLVQQPPSRSVPSVSAPFQPPLVSTPPCSSPGAVNAMRKSPMSPVSTAQVKGKPAQAGVVVTATVDSQQSPADRPPQSTAGAVPPQVFHPPTSAALQTEAPAPRTTAAQSNVTLPAVSFSIPIQVAVPTQIVSQVSVPAPSSVSSSVKALPTQTTVATAVSVSSAPLLSTVVPGQNSVKSNVPGTGPLQDVPPITSPPVANLSGVPPSQSIPAPLEPSLPSTAAPTEASQIAPESVQQEKSQEPVVTDKMGEDITAGSEQGWAKKPINLVPRATAEKPKGPSRRSSRAEKEVEEEPSSGQRHQEEVRQTWNHDCSERSSLALKEVLPGRRPVSQLSAVIMKTKARCFIASSRPLIHSGCTQPPAVCLQPSDYLQCKHEILTPALKLEVAGRKKNTHKHKDKHKDKEYRHKDYKKDKERDKFKHNNSEHKDHSEKKNRDNERLKHTDSSSEKHREKHKDKDKEKEERREGWHRILLHSFKVKSSLIAKPKKEKENGYVRDLSPAAIKNEPEEDNGLYSSPQHNKASRRECDDEEFDCKPKKVKTEHDKKSKKRKHEYEEEDEEEEDIKPKKKKKDKNVTEGKKSKKDEEKWKWRKDPPDGSKWRFLEHKGPVFAPPYEPLPDKVKFYYDGKLMKLAAPAEEVATFFAKMLDHEYTTKDVFRKNFFKDWRKEMTSEEKSKITDLNKCNFAGMNEYFKAQSEARKQMSKEEKQKIKEDNERILQEYGFCIMDNHKERIGNFRIEPPGLFRGRGDHPKMGMLKRRIRPEDIIINCSKDSKHPKPPPGTKWKEVRHDNKVTWLASWTENIQGSIKYIMLNPSSRIKGEKDWQKYETARRLKKCVDRIRNQYREDWKSKEMRIRQRAVALYFIDKLALRAGNEKEEGETADTVGCCSLRVEHINLYPKLDDQEYVVEFDFLGKDSIRYYNRIPVEKRVFKNLQLFLENKQPGDDLFDRLNTSILNKHLQELMDGLTAKVFRTYNASITLQQQLKELSCSDDSVPAKILSYNRANRAVAILCNHQRAPPKTFEKSMQNLQTKIDEKQKQLSAARKQLKAAKAEHKASHDDKSKKAVEVKRKAVQRIEEQLMKLQVQATDREENKQIALGTSKLNYLDPRISVAWCKKFGIPIEKIYNKTQREKFAWAIDMAEKDFEF